MGHKAKKKGVYADASKIFEVDERGQREIATCGQNGYRENGSENSGRQNQAIEAKNARKELTQNARRTRTYFSLLAYGKD